MQGNRGVWSETVVHVLRLTDNYCYCLFVLVFIERESSIYEFEQNKFSRHVCNNGAANFENKYLFWESIFADKTLRDYKHIKSTAKFPKDTNPPPPPSRKATQNNQA